jgi:hypothetical protein
MLACFMPFGHQKSIASEYRIQEVPCRSVSDSSRHATEIDRIDQFQLLLNITYIQLWRNEMASSSKPSGTVFPADFEKQAKVRFDALAERENMDFATYLSSEKAEFVRLAALKTDPALEYKPTQGKMTPCGNGDFETALDPAEWQGAYGKIGNALTAGILSGGIADGASNPAAYGGQSHQTWVPSGPDPIVGIINTAAPGSSGAVRIGNAVRGFGTELLSKTFLVTPGMSTISFWYAVVMQNPDGHALSIQPSFSVLVKDTLSGNIVPGAFDFGTGGDVMPADPNNPFLIEVASPVPTAAELWGDQSGNYMTERLLVKDWSCAQIDLSKQVGKVVTIEFVTRDCGWGGHFAYAYIDNFCGSCKGSPTGSISYDCMDSKHCGKGTICFDYELPHAVVQSPVTGSLVTVTGAVEIKLDILQGGSVIHTLTSGPLTTGDRYCFVVDPAAIPGINASLEGFDFTASGDFSITTSAGTTKLGTQQMGRAPDGMILGTNNDYRMTCRSCEEIRAEHDARVQRKCAAKQNTLQNYDCRCPDGSWVAGGCGCDGASKSVGAEHGDCGCGCGGATASVKHDDGLAHVAAQQDKDPCRKFKSCDLTPEISVRWGDSACDCLESDDVEVLCITVCNHFSNLTYADFSIGQIIVTEMDGTPVPTLPDGSASIQLIPSGAICFGDIGPCVSGRKNCVTREVALYTRGAKGKHYRLSFDGVCFTAQHASKTEACFVLPICQD